MVTVTEAGVTREVPSDDTVMIPIDPANSFPDDDIWTSYGWKGIENDTNREWLLCDPWLTYDRDSEELVIRGNQFTHGHGDKVEIRIDINKVEFGWENIGNREKYEEKYIETTGLNPYEDDFTPNLLPEPEEGFFATGEDLFGRLANTRPTTVSIEGSKLSYNKVQVIAVNEEDREATVDTGNGTVRLRLDTGESSSTGDLEMIFVEDGEDVYVGNVENIEVEA